MTFGRLISLPTHAALELAIGVLTMVSPFLFGFGPAAMVSAVILGALLVGLALATTDGPDSMSISAHYTFDRALSIALLGAAVLLAVGGDSGAALLFALVSLAHGALGLTTRYSQPRGRPAPRR